MLKCSQAAAALAAWEVLKCGGSSRSRRGMGNKVLGEELV
jgi:hypothetical protein